MCASNPTFISFPFLTHIFIPQIYPFSLLLLMIDFINLSILAAPAIINLINLSILADAYNQSHQSIEIHSLHFITRRY